MELPTTQRGTACPLTPKKEKRGSKKHPHEGQFGSREVQEADPSLTNTAKPSSLTITARSSHYEQIASVLRAYSQDLSKKEVAVDFHFCVEGLLQAVSEAEKRELQGAQLGQLPQRSSDHIDQVVHLTAVNEPPKDPQTRFRETVQMFQNLGAPQEQKRPEETPTKGHRRTLSEDERQRFGIPFEPKHYDELLLRAQIQSNPAEVSEENLKERVHTKIELIGGMCGEGVEYGQFSEVTFVAGLKRLCEELIEAINTYELYQDYQEKALRVARNKKELAELVGPLPRGPKKSAKPSPVVRKKGVHSNQTPPPEVGPTRKPKKLDPKSPYASTPPMATPQKGSGHTPRGSRTSRSAPAASENPPGPTSSMDAPKASTSVPSSHVSTSASPPPQGAQARGPSGNRLRRSTLPPTFFLQGQHKADGGDIGGGH